MLARAHEVSGLLLGEAKQESDEVGGDRKRCQNQISYYKLKKTALSGLFFIFIYIT